MSLILTTAAEQALKRLARTVRAREDATKVAEVAQASHDLALESADRAEKLLDDAQTEYESAVAELTRALGGKTFDPVTGDLK